MVITGPITTLDSYPFFPLALPPPSSHPTSSRRTDAVTPTTAPSPLSPSSPSSTSLTPISASTPRATSDPPSDNPGNTTPIPTSPTIPPAPDPAPYASTGSTVALTSKATFTSTSLSPSPTTTVTTTPPHIPVPPAPTATANGTSTDHPTISLPATASPNLPSSAAGRSRLSTGAIAGIAVGLGVATICLVVVAAWYVQRRRGRRARTGVFVRSRIHVRAPPIAAAGRETRHSSNPGPPSSSSRSSSSDANPFVYKTEREILQETRPETPTDSGHGHPPVAQVSAGTDSSASDDRPPSKLSSPNGEGIDTPA